MFFFLTAILLRGLRNDFFFWGRIYFFHILSGLFFPFLFGHFQYVFNTFLICFQYVLNTFSICLFNCDHILDFFHFFFFKYKTIETHARPFLQLNISALGSVNQLLWGLDEGIWKSFSVPHGGNVGPLYTFVNVFPPTSRTFTYVMNCT